jgi:hypothetical protein
LRKNNQANHKKQLTKKTKNMNTTTQTSTSGKGLGVASLVIGIITLLWSLIPIFGAWALWIAIIGLILGLIGFVLAKNGNNPKKGVVIAGIALSVLATGISGYWAYAVKTAADEITKELSSIK